MEQNLPVKAKKLWRLVRVIYFMLRKNLSKSKFMLDLNLMMKKRRKIAGKVIHNLMMFHHHNSSTSATNSPPDHHPSIPQDEYEFSCSNTPAHPFSLFTFHRKHHEPPTHDEHIDMATVNAAANRAMEILRSESASPALPGFGRSPMVRQLRITDSPFPLNDVDEDDHYVDEAAEKFIRKFYKNLRRQNSTYGNSPY